MNHIHKLQAENEALRQQIKKTADEIMAFRLHLNGTKFAGTEGGERKDWIATSDVLNRLSDLRNTLYGLA